MLVVLFSARLIGTRPAPIKQIREMIRLRKTTSIGLIRGWDLLQCAVYFMLWNFAQHYQDEDLRASRKLTGRAPEAHLCRHHHFAISVVVLTTTHAAVLTDTSHQYYYGTLRG